MKNAKSAIAHLDGKDIVIETGVLGPQAAGACTVRIGDTILFSAVTGTDKPREGIDFFPLQVEYREKFYAAGRFPGGFFKREARPAEKEVLTARVTDRPIRPLFPDGYRNEVQINNMLLSADRENDSDVLSVVASSCSLTLSEIPFMGPIAGVRVGRIKGNFVINPTHSELEESDLDLIYCSTRDLPLMIEGSAKEISEKDLVAAMKFAHPNCVALIDAQLELRRMMSLPDKTVEPSVTEDPYLTEAREIAGEDLRNALLVKNNKERKTRTDGIMASIEEKLLEKHPDFSSDNMRPIFEKLETEIVRKYALEEGKRIDGRTFDEIRPLDAEVGIMPRTHGSAVFSRGDTQACGTVTLGTKSDSQSIDAVTGGVGEKRFMLHYNFPPYSVGEVGRLGSTGRREIGHGALAERCLAQVLPEDYPYTLRLVSDIMSSNGSSSMASVCVGSLALMDAGVPITKPVAGVSIGLFSNAEKSLLAVDILGQEDHCGDMDFKAAGTVDGITGFQVDLKIHGLKWDLVEGAFEKAREARLKILDFMGEVIKAPRSELSEYAPRIHEIVIPHDKIGELIGPGGKNIRRITELSGAQIDISDDGTVSIFAEDKESMDMAAREVNMITAEPEVGMLYDGKVAGIKEFGAFVEILPGKDGLVHISELADFRVKNVEDVCSIGDQMWVKCIGIDERGRVRLSRKQAMKEKDA
ncbi:MAG: polyribonucleotide nucleotidyltransferase [Kiritimatiellia bacterium]